MFGLCLMVFPIEFHGDMLLCQRVQGLRADDVMSTHVTQTNPGLFSS